METSDPAASVSLTFTGGAAVSISAPRNYGHWTYNVVRSPVNSGQEISLMHTFYALQNLDGVVSSGNASTLWGIGNTTLFYQDDLDPTKEHEISLINTGNQPYYKLSLNYFTVFALSETDGTTVSPTNRCVVSWLPMKY